MTDTACECEVITKVKINTDLKLPPRYSVIILNDDVTPASFVVQVLVDVFSHSLESAMAITEHVDKNGSGSAASGLTKELADHLCNLIIVKARAEQYPLAANIKEETE